MTKTFKVLSALLSYPDAAVIEAVPQLRQALDEEKLLPPETRSLLDALIDEMATGDSYDLQERYVELFDRTRSLSLHLFEHVHGESRDRGQAMIDLKSVYEQNGLTLSATELPDHLPVFLEFLSTRPLPEALQTLGQTAHILSALAERLHKRGAPYEAVFRALEALAVPAADTADIEIVPEDPDADPNDFAALDAQWEEEAVTFGPDAMPGCKDRLVAQIRAGRRPVPDVPMKGEAP
jgi:nitrate reductase molybdenum cofactor assembly chaperone NarJ/NarW